MVGRIILGTRGSDLAQRQTALTVDRLQKRWADLEVEIRNIRTRGDEGAAGQEAPAGRKGVFTAEIEKALLSGEIDVAVHSAKDLPSEMSAGLEVAAVLPRGPVNDVLVAIAPRDLHSLPLGGIVATGSVRRKYQLLWKRPDLNIVDLRGNVPTRLRNLAEKQWDGIVLAQAGLERLGLLVDHGQIRWEENDFFIEPFPVETFLPAGGQGTIAMQIRKDDGRSRMFVEAVDDLEARVCLGAEREFLRLLQADCNQPIGVLAVTEGARLKISAQIFGPGPPAPKTATVEGPAEEAEPLAAKLLKAIHGL